MTQSKGSSRLVASLPGNRNKTGLLNVMLLHEIGLWTKPSKEDYVR